MPRKNIRQDTKPNRYHIFPLPHVTSKNLTNEIPYPLGLLAILDAAQLNITRNGATEPEKNEL